MTHPQLLSDLTTQHCADFARAAGRRSHADATHRATRARASAVAGLLLRIAARLDPAAIPGSPQAAGQRRVPAFNA
jgi:hypothetical protein